MSAEKMGTPEAFVVPLAGSGAEAAALVRRLLPRACTTVVPLSQLLNANGRSTLGQRFEYVAIVGAPPRSEVGFGLAVLVAVVVRPRRVALVDAAHERAVWSPLARYLTAAVPFAAGQLAASGFALGAQRLAVAVAGHSDGVRRTSDLSRLLYLRPIVGSTSGVGGAVTHTHEVIRALGNCGVTVYPFTTDEHIAATAATEPEPPCTWHVVRVPRLTKAVPASSAAGGDASLLRAAFRATRSVDAIYQRHARFSLAGALLSRLTRKPLILEFNGSEVYKGRYWNPTPFNRRLARCEDAALQAASLIVVVSDVDRRLLVERGIDERRILVNPNGVAADRFSTGGGSTVRSRLGLSPDDLVFGFVGSFGPWHGAPVLAEAFRTVAPEQPRARLLLVGGGPELEQTLQILRAANLDDRVTATGVIAPSDVAGHLDACDILVSPHVPLAGGIEFFGSPTKLFEYMAAGKAIVASDLGQIGEILTNTRTALLVRAGDVGDLADALRRLAAAPEMRAVLGRNARECARERHGWDRNARRILDAYRQLPDHEASGERS